MDVGDKRIGVALSDPGGILATPFIIIDRQDDTRDIAAILNIVSQQKVEQIIVGLPISMDGSLGRQVAKVESFTQNLRSQTITPIEFRDERLTTVSARRLMQAVSHKKTKSKVRQDARAAAIILQSYLDETKTDE